MVVKSATKTVQEDGIQVAENTIAGDGNKPTSVTVFDVMLSVSKDTKLTAWANRFEDHGTFVSEHRSPNEAFL